MKHFSITLLFVLILSLTNGLVLGQDFSVYCGVGFDLSLRAPLDPTITDNNTKSTEEDSCIGLFFRADGYRSGGAYRKGYDSLRYAMEHCPNFVIAPSFFHSIDGAVANMSNDTTRFIDYREWLKKVLYLNTQDWKYYCADVESIMFTMNYFPGRGNDVNGSLAILKYVVESGKCMKEFFGSSDTTSSLWSRTRLIQYHNWQDSVRDSIATPFDTTLPSLESLNLQILFGQDFVVHEHEVIDPSAISLLEASPNPCVNTTELHYRIRSTAALRLSVYDALGKEVYNDPIGFRPEGDYTLKLNTALWPSGSYFARLSSLVGGVVTVKIIRE